MHRVILHHEGQAIALDPGDTVIGRALHCRVRFNDAAVSREHLRLVTRGDRVVAQNLSRSNGTLLNGVVLDGAVALSSGDVLRIGYRKLRVEIVDLQRTRAPSAPPIMVVSRELEAGSGIFIDDDEAAAEATMPGDDGETGASSLTQSLADSVKEHTCPRCRARSSYFEDACPRCGYEWPAGRPSSRTQEIVVEQVALRAHPRFAVDVPVVYSSESLAIDALVRDLSRGGMFISTDLLDPVGTMCELTALPDGHAAVSFTGVVAHVVTVANHHGRPAGFGVRFTGQSPAAAAWLDHVLAGMAKPVEAIDGDATVGIRRIDPEE